MLEYLFDYLRLLGVFFKYTWWIFLPFSLYAIFKPVWQKFTVNRYFAERINLKLLRIKIPNDLLVNPKNMESVLAGLSGTGRTITIYESLTRGSVQDFFSFEIVSNEGDVGFYVLTPKRSQLLIERLFYSQFPGIEISEVDDYTKAIPETVPDENWNLWGGKYILEKGQERPINTYPYFEDKISGELVDPLSGIFEMMGNLGPGEHLWFQIQVTPALPEWRKQAMTEIEKILKKYNIGSEADFSEGSMMKILPHHELELVKAIHSKMAKPGFNCQIIFAYIARKENYRDIVPGMVGGTIKQFENGDINGFVGDKYYTTSTFYLASGQRKNFRKRRLVDMLRDRDMQGEVPVTLNSEEVATLFHFPTPTAKIPSIPRLDSKTAPAPSNLPVEK